MKRTIGLLVACGLAGGIGGWIGQGLPLAGAAAGAQAAVGFTPLEPTRIYDSRGPEGDPATPILPAGSVITVNPDVPDGASAVAVNIAMTQTAGPGFITAWGSGERPRAAVINATSAGENVSNYVVVPLAADGTFRFYTHEGTHVVIDRMGFFAAAETSGPLFDASITDYTAMKAGNAVIGYRVNGLVSNRGDAKSSVRIELDCAGDGLVFGIEVYAVRPGVATLWSGVCPSTTPPDHASVETFPI